MKKTFTLSLLSMFVFSVIFAGCGWIKTEKEFTNWLDGYTDKEGQTHEGFQSKIDTADQGLSDRISELDGKVDAQNEALSADIQQSKEAAIAAAEQGDAEYSVTEHSTFEQPFRAQPLSARRLKGTA